MTIDEVRDRLNQRKKRREEQVTAYRQTQMPSQAPQTTNSWQNVQSRVNNQNNTVSNIANTASAIGRGVGFATKVGSMLFNRANEVSSNLNNKEKNEQRAESVKKILPTNPITSAINTTTENINILKDKDKSIADKAKGVASNTLNYLPRRTTSKSSTKF